MQGTLQNVKKKKIQSVLVNNNGCRTNCYKKLNTELGSSMLNPGIIPLLRNRNFDQK